MNMTPEQMAERLRREWPKESARAIGLGARRGLYYAAKLALRAVQNTAIGRGILGRYGISGLDRLQRGASRISSSQVRMFIKRATMVKRGDQWQTGLEGIGFAALIEKGGRTALHTIAAKPGELLANVGTGEVFGRAVRHPGSRVPREPYLGQAVLSSQGRITAEIDKGFAKLQQYLVG